MAKVIAMYKTPADAAAFDRYDFGTHVPIAKRIPVPRQHEATSGAVICICDTRSA